MPCSPDDFRVEVDPETGRVQSVALYGNELLDTELPVPAEVYVNGLPLSMRPHPVAEQGGKEGETWTRLKGERFTDHFSGWGLVAARSMGGRKTLQWNCYGINYQLRRELCDMTDLPSPGPGGPVTEAPMWVDTFGLLNWNWRFWGDRTRMIFPSSHSQGPSDEFGHIGYEHDTPERCKAFLQNVWRRLYPSEMAVHGGLFYDAETEHWLAMTCRRPHVGYILNIEDAGQGVGYDFTLHAPFGIGDNLRMPEIKLYYGATAEEMWRWLGWYVTFYYQEPPAWTRRTVFMEGVAWNNRPTWTEQADSWEERLDREECDGVSYCLVTNRPISSGTLPIGYEPDPNHGTQAEFKAMCRRMADRSAPVLIWMSHSGLVMGAPDIDDDWFIRGINGEPNAGWGSRDGGMLMCNPGHPGYIEYTKKWIRFYIGECGCKGIFFDCLGWAFPPDYRPRDFMRYPGDTNLMTIRFMEEVYACVKACDPEAIVLGEGVSLEGPVDIFSIGGNPVRAIDGMGPRDFFLYLNRFAPKTMTIDQGGRLFPSSGMCVADKEDAPEAMARNRCFTQLVRKYGQEKAFVHLPGDLSILPEENLLFFPRKGEAPPNTKFFPPRDVFSLPEPWNEVTVLREKFEKTEYSREGDGRFHGVTAGIYEMRKG